LISRCGEAERRIHNSVPASSTLHQEIPVPLVGHGQRKADAEFFFSNAYAPIDDSLNAAVCGEHKGLSR
jgi:hypothetical protein